MTEERCPKPAEESAAAGPASAASRQRKKRKWDQPAESLISAGVSVTGSFPLGVNGIVGTPLPGSVPLPSSAIPNAVLADAATASLFFHSSSITKNTAAIVQKLTQFPIQPKIQDELIAREIVINDAEPTVRYKLTKRQTQEEIQTSTGAVVITRGKYRPPNALPDSEKPLYLHISAGSHLKDTAERIKAVDRAASIVEDILKQGQNSLPSTTPSHSVINNGQAMQLLSTCLFLGFETDPSFNIAARIRGLNDQYINHIMNETGVTVVLRGQGSGNVESSICEESQQPLHLYLSSTSPQSLEAARSLAENLLHTIYIECGASRTSSCKAYCAVPSPQQMLARSRNSEEVLNVNTNPVSSLPSTPTTSMPIFPPIVPNGSSTVPPGPLPHSGTILSSGNPEPHMVYPSVNKGTCYRGYGGLYPQATPLQQVALALRKAPATTPPGLASTTSTVSVLPKPTSSTVIETEKRIPQRRKFKELPVPSKKLTVHHQNSLQGSECLKPGSEDSGVENAALMPPQNKLVHLNSSEMPPPSPPTMPPLPLVLPPKFKPPSPPPKFVAPRLLPRIKNDGEPEMMKLNSEPISDTLLKLVEYGEEEDDDTDILGKESLGNMLAQKPSSKPFWAV